MSVLKFSAGTDVAEMALFDADAATDAEALDSEAVDQIANSGRLIRFPTGGDGGYLLHLFIDEHIPNELKEFCSEEDVRSGVYRQVGKSIAFGGLESVRKNFKPNQFIRSDSAFNPGEYKFTAYWTEIPNHIVSARIESSISPEERRLMKIPIATTLVAALFAAVLIGLGKQLFGAIALFAAYGVIRKLSGSQAYQRVKEKMCQAQLGFPNMVIEMWQV